MGKQKILSLFLTMIITLSFCGCGAEVKEVSGATIELIEPVNATANTENVAYRTLYDTTIYSATVYPVVEEYAFSKDVSVEGYAAYLGEEVSKGGTLVYANTDSLEKQIETMEESIASMEEDFEEYKADLLEGLLEPKEELKRIENVIQNFKNSEPEKMIPDTSVSAGDAGESMVENPEYIQWEKDTYAWEGKYRIQAHNINMQEEALRQRTAIYELDHAYSLSQLAKLKEQLKDGSVTSQINGSVVAIAQADYGTLYAGQDVPIVAVGSSEELILKSDYINKDEINKAQDVYALIGGVRYEVDYQVMDSDEYSKLSANGGKVYSTFLLEGDTGNVGAGDFAVIVVTKAKSENVLSVSKGALNKDETGYYTYVVKDGENVYTSVKTGMSDGVYTEITSGLSEGDAVLVENAVEYSGDTVTVEKGSFSSTFENNGYMYYPVTEAVTNEITYGTTYFGEYQVAQYQHVEKGDVIATIYVKSDDMTIERNQIKLQRAQERLADLIAAGEEANEDAILAKEEEIADLEEVLAEIRADARTTEIVADKSGMIVALASYEAEDIVSSGAEIVAIAEESTCYVVLENTNLLLNYGNKVTVTYTNNEGVEKNVEGMVANVSPAGLSQELQLEYSFISLPDEAVADMAVSNTGGGWWNRNRYNVTATIREMDNVLVVPNKAVTEINGVTYVNIMNEDGSITQQSFVAGGYDKSGYWVVEGLTEGMILCLK